MVRKISPQPITDMLHPAQEFNAGLEAAIVYCLGLLWADEFAYSCEDKKLAERASKRQQRIVPAKGFILEHN